MTEPVDLDALEHWRGHVTEPVDLDALEKNIRSGVDPEVGYYRDRYSSAILAIIAELRELRAWKERLEALHIDAYPGLRALLERAKE